MGVIAHALDNIGGVQSFFFGVGVDFIEIGHADGQEGVGEELDGFRFRRACNEHGNIFLNGSFLHEGSKEPGLWEEGFLPLGNAYDNAGRIEVVVKGLPFPKKFRRKEDGKLGIPGGNFLGVADGDGGFDNHHRFGTCLADLGKNGLHRPGVKAAGYVVVIGGSGKNDKLWYDSTRKTE